MHQRKQKIVLKGFSFKVDELIIEQETSELGMSDQDTALKAIGQVFSAPQHLLGIESGGSVHATSPVAQLHAEQNGVPEQGKRRRRRRGRNTNTDNEVLPQSADGEPKQTKGRSSSSSSSARNLLEEIHSEGFFAQDRSIAEVREELHTRGHAFKSNEISPSLLALTKNKILARKKDPKGNWVYRDGANGQ